MKPLESLFGPEASVLHQRDFQLLMVANMFPVLGTGLVSPILESLTGPLNTTTADLSLMISVFSAPSIVVIPLAGMLADRYGRRPILILALVLFGVAGTAIALTRDFGVVLALRALQGIAFAGIGPVIITSIGDLYDESTETTAQGIRFTGSGLTSASFPLLAGTIVVVGWQYPFLLYALALPTAVAVYVWFDEPTARREGASVSVADGGTDSSQLSALFGLLSQRRVLAFVIARGLPVATWFGFLTYNSVVIVRFADGSPSTAGLLITVASLAYAVTASQSGRLTERFPNQWLPLFGGNLCLGLGFIGFLLAPGLPLKSVGIGIAGIGFGIVLSLYRSIITGLASEELRGGLVSVGEGFGRVVATVTPVLMGATIAVAEPRVGLEAAIQIAGIGVGLTSAVGGVACLLVARSGSPVCHDDPVGS